MRDSTLVVEKKLHVGRGGFGRAALSICKRIAYGVCKLLE